MKNNDKELTVHAYQKSVELLKNNSSKYGFLAAGMTATAKHRRYLDIFGRDAMICGLGALAAEDKRLLKTFRLSLVTLAKYISPTGQIPFAVGPIDNFTRFHLPRSVDGNLWWLIGYWLYSGLAPDKSFEREYKDVFYQALAWLEERLNFGLIEQGEAADWADEMPRSGLVLYSNALWLLFLRLINSREKDIIYRNFLFFFSTDSLLKKDYVNLFSLFPYFRRNLKKQIGKRPYFLTAVSRVTIEDSFDVFGNILACLSGLVSEKKVEKIIKEIIKQQANKVGPIRSLARPISLKQAGVFEEYFQNKHWHYHNAGIWPMIGGFWVYLLAKYGKLELAKEELVRLAKLNQKNNWQFNEYMHGRTGRPLGVKYQSWNAAAYILAYKAAEENKFII